MSNSSAVSVGRILISNDDGLDAIGIAILEEIAVEQENIKIAKVNVDDSPDLARRYEIMSIPALIVFENGEPAKKLIGAKPKGALLEEIGEFL